MATLAASSEDTRIYECAVLYPHPIAQKEEADLIKEIEGMFADAGATLKMKDAWGRRGLAYTIRGYDEANVVIYYYDMDPSKVKEIDQQLKILKGVLRHMIIKPPKNYQMVPYADALERWQESQRMAEEQATKDKEDKLRKQVVEKAKRQTKTAEKKKSDDGADMKPKADLGSQLDKLISDKDLEI